MVMFFYSCSDAQTCNYTGGENGGGDSSTGGVGGWWDSISSLDSLRSMVDGWIGETLSFLVSPLNAIADAVQWVASGIGGELQNMSRDFSEWYDGITSNFTSLGDSIGGFFYFGHLQYLL